MTIVKMMILCICLALPFLLTFINHKFWHKRFGNLALSLVACVFCWLLIQGSVQLVEWNLQNQLDSFDLNHDGIFGENEIPPQQDKAFKEAFNALVSDTGRALAPITGAIASIVYNTIIFIVLACVNFNKAKQSQ